MPFNMGRCAIIRTIFSMRVLFVCLLVGPTLSSGYSPEEYQGFVKRNTTTAKLRDYARQPSKLNPISLSAPLFRNGILGAARFETDSSFKLDARAGGCQCSELNNECCTPRASSEAPFCMPTGSICCTNTYCVETESCCGDGGCCAANTTCYMKSNGPSCCPNGHFCSEPAICYDYISSNCSDNNNPSAQCCPPDLPFCNFSEQVGYGCYATSATATSSTSSTNPSTTIPKSDLTTTSSSTQTSSTKTITVATISPKPTTLPSPIISASSSPPISTPPNSITTTGIAEFPLATTISTSQSSPILAPFRFIIDHPYIFLLLYTLWILGLIQEGISNLLNIVMAPWMLANLIYFIFFHKVPVQTPPPAEILAEEGEEEVGSQENETRKKRSLHFMYSIFFHEVPVPTPPPAEIPAEELEEEAGSGDENEARRAETQLMKDWRLERQERRVEMRERRLEMQRGILERLQRRRDKVDRQLERVQWRKSTERMAQPMEK